MTFLPGTGRHRKKKLPSEAGGGATPFVPGRSGGTASKRTDPMDDD